MPSNREAYFAALKRGVSKSIVDFVLQAINGYTYSDLAQHLDDEIKDHNKFLNAIERYLDGEMIEYILNKSYFLSIPFYVDKNVLIPRQETEQLVMRTTQMIDELFGKSKITIADVCTGSGCIGISIAKELSNNTYFLSDISKEALRVAKKNTDLCPNANIKCLQGNMLDPLKGTKLDVIVCNPPYIADINGIDEKTWKQEPHLALLAEPATLYYEKVLSECSLVLNHKYLIAFEIGEDMKEVLTKLVEKYCPDAIYFFENDIYGETRFLFIKQLGI